MDCASGSPCSAAVASTTDGRYFLRVADASRPVIGDEIMRLAGERAALPWETQVSLGVLREGVDTVMCAALIGALRASDRVKPSVAEKTDAEPSGSLPARQGRFADQPGGALRRTA